MDNNDSNLKSQQTGGLKLMTVFIAVLALHVVVIGGFTVYHLMSGGSTDTDLTTGDKSHKGLNGSTTADGSMADTTQTDKSSAPTEVANIPATTVTPSPTTTTPTADTSATTTASTSPTIATMAPSTSTTSTDTTSAAAPTPDTTAVATSSTTTASTVAPAPTPAQTMTTPTQTANTMATPAPVPAPVTEVANPGSQTPSGPISPELAPPPDSAPISTPSVAPISQPAPAASIASGPVHMPPAENSAEAPRPHEHMQVYIVKITDSYKKIAHRHHISVAQLKEANHIDGNVLHTGQKLYIPSEKTKMAEKNEVAEKTSTSSLAASPVVNGSAAPMTTGLTSTSTTVAMTGPRHHLYTVVKGDTLTRIAHHFKTTPSAIMAENGITDPTKLSIGKKLRIPSSSSEEIRSARALPVTPQPSQVQAKTNTTTAQLANYAN